MAHVALADKGQTLAHPKTWIGAYVWSQDHKVIGIQYIITATAVGLVALVLSALMRLQLGFPGVFTLIQPNEYYSAVT
ncbi:MAG: cytochrome c oxidase subunit I, partial [Gammaproteobacteria bacterium]